MDAHKEKFLRNEFLTMSVNGALGRSKIYSKSATTKDKDSFRNELRKELNEVSKLYKSPVTEEEHLSNIENLSKNLTSKFHHCLKDGRFRLGVAQKALNLYLKYLWCTDLITVPPHCPFDAIVISYLPDCNDLKWTSIDDIGDYLRILKAARIKADGKSIADWELEFWLNKVQLKRFPKKGRNKVSKLPPKKEDIAMEVPDKDNTKKYIEELITKHKYRIKPKGKDGLTEKQKNLYDTIKKLFYRNPNQVLTTKNISDEHKILHGPLNLLPTDFCYNLVNMGPDFETKYLIWTERGEFKFVGFNWIAGESNEIYWKPKGPKVPKELNGESFIVGYYYKGQYSWDFSEVYEYL